MLSYRRLAIIVLNDAKSGILARPMSVIVQRGRLLPRLRACNNAPDVPGYKAASPKMHQALRPQFECNHPSRVSNTNMLRGLLVGGHLARTDFLSEDSK